MHLHPYARYSLWRCVAPAVIFAGRVGRAIPWRRIGTELLTFGLAALLLVTLIAINVGLTALERF